MIAGTQIFVFHGIQPRLFLHFAHDRLFGGFAFFYIPRKHEKIAVGVPCDEHAVLRLIDGDHIDGRFEERKLKFPASVAVGDKPFVVAKFQGQFFTAVLTVHNDPLLLVFFLEYTFFYKMSIG